MKITESLVAEGHRNIRGTHMTTVEITKGETLTSRGDCIVAVRATKSLSDLDSSLKNLLRKSSSRVTLTLEIEDLKDEIKGFGDPRLPLTSNEAIVCRKSNFICGRTLMIQANKAATEIDRSIIRALRNQNNKAYVTLSVEC